MYTKEESLRKRLQTALKPVDELDKKLTQQFAVCATKNSSHGKWRSYMQWLEYSCHGLVWLPGCLVLLWFFQDIEYKQIIVNLIAGIVLDLCFVAVIKAVVRRRRPPANKDDMFFTVGVDKYAFPSGHTSRATMLALLFKCKHIGGIIFTLLATVWAGAVCISRVLLGRHHLGDVIGGVLLGFVEAGIMSYVWFSAEGAESILRIFTLFEIFHTSDIDL